MVVGVRRASGVEKWLPVSPSLSAMVFIRPVKTLTASATALREDSPPDPRPHAHGHGIGGVVA